MYKEMIDRLLAYPQRGRLKIDFDVKNKIFCFTIPIFSSREVPSNIKAYVETRKEATFKPHETSFRLEGTQVFLIQKLPFQGGFQETLRDNVDQFWNMSKNCGRMLAEMAVEEKYKDALKLPT
jgi:hypothetical protein